MGIKRGGAAGVELFFRDSLACALIKSALPFCGALACALVKSALPFAVHWRALLSRARYLFAAHWHRRSSSVALFHPYQ